MWEMKWWNMRNCFNCFNSLSLNDEPVIRVDRHGISHSGIQRATSKNIWIIEQSKLLIFVFIQGHAHWHLCSWCEVMPALHCRHIHSVVLKVYRDDFGEWLRVLGLCGSLLVRLTPPPLAAGAPVCCTLCPGGGAPSHPVGIPLAVWGGRTPPRERDCSHTPQSPRAQPPPSGVTAIKQKTIMSPLAIVTILHLTSVLLRWRVESKGRSVWSSRHSWGCRSFRI